MNDQVVEKAAETVLTVQNNPVLTVENNAKPKPGQLVILPNGIHIKLRSVPANLINEVMQAIPDAEMPTFTNPETGKEEPNPASPKYARAQNEVLVKRQGAAMDAMLFYGVQLLDPIPPASEWLDDVQFIMNRVGKPIELNIGNANEVKLFYLKYVVADAELLGMLTEISGVSEKEVAQAKQTFPS